ncbi:O-antigen ligase family protein [Enterococcus ureilyticus]|uniref:O-antigen ligase family protein n=1 Tax=Enterococcus ureilyticus TaxID=1131292 RepID=UPI001A930C9F|nr:O-antigen ligase family protein [Enterococcus ureilyticus]MBO0446568.1 O-antigen ligase family protein [Enterococcus ureilyticus]
MITVLIGICLISLVCLFVFLVKSAFRTKKNIISSILVILVSLVLIVAVKNYEDKVEAEQKVKQEQIAREKAETELKAKEKQEEEEKVEAEKKAKEEREEQEAKEKAEAEQRNKKEQIEKAEAEQKLKEEESQKINDINTVKMQLIGKKYNITPSLYDGIDVNKAMSENKAPQSLVHDGFNGVTFKDDNIAHLELLGTYRPDTDVNYTVTEDTLLVGQHNIPYSINNGIVTFGTWTTNYTDGHTITWSIAPSN